jgi:hypothetical protein
MRHRRLCALAISVLCALAPVRARAEPTGETADAGASRTTAPAEPSTDAPSDAATDEASPTAASEPEEPSTTDAIHTELVRQFTKHFQAGRLQSSRGAYALAAAEFEKAFAAIPAEAALRNAVATHERAGDLVAAATGAKLYLDLPACGTPGVDVALCCSHRDEVEAALQRLSGQLGSLRVVVAKGVALREIRINGRQRALVDFPLWVTPGSIDVELVGSKAERRQRVIEVRAGEVQDIRVDPFDAPVVRPDPRTGDPSSARNRGRWRRPLFYSGVGLTAASGVALVTVGSLSLVAKREFERQQQLFLENPPMVDESGNVGEPKYPFPYEERADHRRFRAATNVLVGVTSGLAVVTAILGIAAFRRRSSGSGARASTMVRWRFEGAGLTVAW